MVTSDKCRGELIALLHAVVVDVVVVVDGDIVLAAICRPNSEVATSLDSLVIRASWAFARVVVVSVVASGCGGGGGGGGDECGGVVATLSNAATSTSERSNSNSSSMWVPAKPLAHSGHNIRARSAVLNG